jgi:hypothetical protein
MKRTARCPACGKIVAVRKDGSLGAHAVAWVSGPEDVDGQPTEWRPVHCIYGQSRRRVAA